MKAFWVRKRADIDLSCLLSAELDYSRRAALLKPIDCEILMKFSALLQCKAGKIQIVWIKFMKFLRKSIEYPFWKEIFWRRRQETAGGGQCGEGRNDEE